VPAAIQFIILRFPLCCLKT